jgi:hypothetical protein
MGKSADSGALLEPLLDAGLDGSAGTAFVDVDSAGTDVGAASILESLTATRRAPSEPISGGSVTVPSPSAQNADS